MHNRFPDSNNHLSQLLKQDIRKGFEILYNQQFAAVFYFARGFVSDQQAAEDITTETFLKLWQRLNDFTNISAIRSFLYTTTKNACLNYLRDSRHRNAENDKMAYLLEKSDESFLAKEKLNADIWQHIYSAIENLSPQLKKVFKMAYIKGLSNDEIATHLGINNQSVRNDKARALKQVRLTLLDRKLFSHFFFWLTLLSLIKHKATLNLLQ
jgi:RNA polymerase sigma-70 factor (ECF subfamily)